jgi:hypothetical protein
VCIVYTDWGRLVKSLGPLEPETLSLLLYCASRSRGAFSFPSHRRGGSLGPTTSKRTHRAERTPDTKTALQRGPETPGPVVGVVDADTINGQRRTAKNPRGLWYRAPRRAGHGSQLRLGWPGEWSATRTADKPSQSSPLELPTA